MSDEQKYRVAYDCGRLDGDYEVMLLMELHPDGSLTVTDEMYERPPAPVESEKGE